MRHGYSIANVVIQQYMWLFSGTHVYLAADGCSVEHGAPYDRTNNLGTTLVSLDLFSRTVNYEPFSMGLFTLV